MTGPDDRAVTADWDRWRHARMAFNDAARVPLQTLEDIDLRYRGLEPDERRAVAAYMSRMTASDDPSERWFAIAFVREFGLTEALPTLRALAERWAAGPARGPAGADLATVRELVADLESGAVAPS